MAALPRDSLVARMLSRGTLPAWNLLEKVGFCSPEFHVTPWRFGPKMFPTASDARAAGVQGILLV